MYIENYFVEQGEGEPLILLHGNGEDHTYFAHQIKYFSREYRVIAIDTRGHGKSPRGEAPFTIAQFADDLHHFMQVQGIPKAHILGFSDGGNIAMVFAMKYPECVDKLILDGANLYAHGLKFSVEYAIRRDYFHAKRKARRDKAALAEVEMLRLMIADPNLRPDDLTKIKARTLVIAGTRDMIKRSHTELIFAHIDNSEIAFVEGDHFIANKRYWKFNMAVEKFLKKEYED